MTKGHSSGSKKQSRSNLDAFHSEVRKLKVDIKDEASGAKGYRAEASMLRKAGDVKDAKILASHARDEARHEREDKAVEKHVQAQTTSMHEKAKFQDNLATAVNKADARGRYGGAVPIYAIWNDFKDTMSWNEFQRNLKSSMDARAIDLGVVNDLSVFSHPDLVVKLDKGPAGYVSLRESPKRNTIE